MYALMFHHTSNSSDSVLEYYSTKAAAQAALRHAANELKRIALHGHVIRQANRVELRYVSGGGCAYYVEKE